MIVLGIESATESVGVALAGSDGVLAMSKLLEAVVMPSRSFLVFSSSANEPISNFLKWELLQLISDLDCLLA